jgi:tetratricopeptide (TPR) repeat protein/mono/diheme cytochrome c family protein
MAIRKSSGGAAALAALMFGLSAAAACRQAPPGHAAPPSTAQAPTFNKDVAPILFANCSTCHRPVDPRASASEPICFAGAPFSLLHYSDARTHAREIARATRDRVMPPWLPEHASGQVGEFANPRILTDAQIELIDRWVRQGTPEGEASDLPAVPGWPQGWQLGEPDLVLKMPAAYTLPATGRDIFRNFVIPVPLATTRYVRAIEFRADNPAVLHHASVGIDRMRLARKLDRADAGPGFAAMPDDEVQTVFGWSPGKVPFMEPVDRAWTLPKGSDLVVQLHMLPGGTAQSVQPTIGLFLSDTPPQHEPLTVKLESKAIDIPAGKAAYAIEDHYVLPADVDVLSVYPHAHYLARQMLGTATLPDGTTRTLISIPSWDFRWQDQYRYATPVFLPKGTTLSMRFTYDNSDGNRRNPRRPARRVKWGPQSTDEMGALWLEILPRDRADVPALLKDFVARTLRADIAGAEMQVAVSPADPLAHNFLATRYLQAGRVADAVAQLNEALRLKPGDAEAHSNLATALQAQGQLAEAVQHAREAVRLKPDDDRVHFNLGNLMMASGQPEEAERELRRAVQINPDNGDAQFNLGVLLGSRNQLDEAIAHLRRAVEINPQNADAHRNLGLGLGFQGKLDEGIDELRTTLRIQPDSAEAQRNLASLLEAKARVK